MKKYQLLKSRQYIIYGAAFMGRFVEIGLRKAGYKVSAFLDKRADIIGEVAGIQVYHPDFFENDDKDNSVVIIAITNPFEHPMVAKHLVDMGYKKIIYKMSVDNKYKSVYAQNLFDTYENILTGKIDDESIVFEYTQDFSNIYFEEAALIDEKDDNVVVYVPVELCFGSFNADLPMTDADRENNPDVIDSFDKPILYSEKWVIDLFRGFEGYGNVGKAIEEFANYLYRNPWRYYSFPKTKQGLDDLITNRYTLFIQMSQQLNKGMEFFFRTPIELKWNEKGYFNIEDGVHRVCFFIAKGLPRIPSRMKRVDYEKWINRDKLGKCIQFLQENDCPPAYTPIPHPNFYNYPTYRDMGGILRIQRLFEYLKGQNIEIDGKKVLEIGSYFSYFAHFFYKMGAGVTTVEVRKNSYELGKLFNELLYCEKIKALLGDIETIELDDEYDFTVMLTVIYPYIETEKGRRILKKIDKATSKMLLWESGEESEKEIAFILKETTFSRYEKIAETYGTGKSRELGAFYKIIF